MAAFSGLGLRAGAPLSEARRAVLTGSSSSLAGPSEVTRLAGYCHLRPGSPERAGDPGQRVGQRAARGLGAVLPSYLHCECSSAL